MSDCNKCIWHRVTPEHPLQKEWCSCPVEDDEMPPLPHGDCLYYRPDWLRMVDPSRYHGIGGFALRIVVTSVLVAMLWGAAIAVGCIFYLTAKGLGA